MHCYQLIFADQKHSYRLRIIADSCSVFIAFIFAGKFIATKMTSRTTRNSQVAAFDATISPADINPSSSVASSSFVFLYNESTIP